MVDFAILDDRERIGGIDREDMLGVVYKFPDALEEAVKFATEALIKNLKNLRTVVFSGMGGSAVGGDVISAVVANGPEVNFIVNRNYNVPTFAAKGDLFIAISYSGNTEETLSSLDEAEKKGMNIVAVSSGGKLSQIARQKGYPLISVPTGLQPRAALPYVLSPILVLLERLGLADGASDQIKEAVKVLRNLRDEYVRNGKGSPVKALANRILNKAPLIYSCDGLTAAAARRWMAQLNENGKVLAHTALFPEMDHNELVGLSNLKRGEHNYSLVILRDEGDLERTKKRIEVTKSLISSQLGGVWEISSSGKGRLSRVLSLILYGDFLSVYLAILQGIDPTPVDIIEKLKRELAR